MKEINVVWLKRDLRLNDHACFAAAEIEGIPYIAVYCFEPTLLKSPDLSTRHLKFIYHSVLQMQKKLDVFSRPLLILHLDFVDALKSIISSYKIKNIFAHQEHGCKRTWQRDKGLLNFCESHDIDFLEVEHSGIIRGIRNRENWDKYWFTKHSESLIKNTYTSSSFSFDENIFSSDAKFFDKLKNYSDKMQIPGEDAAHAYLNSFLNERGKNYHRHISKPQLSRKSCGRLSPYLAWGNISSKQVYQSVKNSESYNNNKRAYSGFLTRVKWRSHFIQKFEVECSYEFLCLNKGYELMKCDYNCDFIKAWEEGKTGYPMIDACMRSLHETGWVNFRMRAMLVSFFCHHLAQDWRNGVYHLARLFLDYEPGIHYPQFQMQAGTTGINTVRIYNPVKQSKDNDPEGVFIRTWIPELNELNNEEIHEPWKIEPMEAAMKGYKTYQNYPNPIVDIKETYRMARDRIWGMRKNSLVQKEKLRILELHTR